MLLAQLNWLALRMERSTLTYPYEITTKQDTQYYVQNEEEMKTFTDLAIAHKESIIKLGRALKIQILSCENLEELESIVDER